MFAAKMKTVQDQHNVISSSQMAMAVLESFSKKSSSKKFQYWTKSPLFLWWFWLKRCCWWLLCCGDWTTVAIAVVDCSTSVSISTFANACKPVTVTEPHVNPSKSACRVDLDDDACNWCDEISDEWTWLNDDSTPLVVALENWYSVTWRESLTGDCSRWSPLDSWVEDSSGWTDGCNGWRNCRSSSVISEDKIYNLVTVNFQVEACSIWRLQACRNVQGVGKILVF